MALRKSKTVSIQKKQWQSFCQDNQILISRIGLPSSVIERQDHFEDLLMHGYLDHHDDPARFTVDQLNEEQFGLFRMLVDHYFATGYSDPGLIILSNEERNDLVKKYPEQFSRRS